MSGRSSPGAGGEGPSDPPLDGPSLKEPMPLKSHFSYCLLNNIGLNKLVSCGKFEIYAVCLLNAIGNERNKAEEMSRSG